MLLDVLIRWSLRNRLVVLAGAAAFLVWGGSLALRMPVDVLPDLTAPTVTVLVEAQGMAPGDMEALVTYPIEAVLNGAAGVRRVRSATAVGIAVIWVDFDWGADIYRARQTVTEKLATVAATLPASAGAPLLAPLSSIMGEIMFVALEPAAPPAPGAAAPTPLELRTTADVLVRRRLLAVPGVSQVTVIGGERRQFEVLANPERLDNYDVPLGTLEAALRRASGNTSAGFRQAGGNEYLIRGAGRALGVEGIGATVVATRGTLPIRVQDVASLRIGESIKRGDGSRNGQPAVILGIQRQPDVNTLALTRQLDGVLDDLQAELPRGMRLDTRLLRQADFIELALGNLLDALRDGTLLVMVVTLLFLANLRAGAITLLAIPLSLLAAVAGLRMAGLSINGMTLGGMAIAVGALVDDAVIDVENVTRRLRENAGLPAAERRPALEVVYRASREIRASIAYATFVVMLVFVPLFFLPGVEGRLLQPLGLAYLIALFASLVVALTVTPALCLYLLPGVRQVREAREPALAAGCKRAYARLLPGVLRRPWLVIGTAALLLAGALATVPRMGRAFLPEFNEGALVISAVTLPGTSLAESNLLGNAIERLLLEVPEVAATARRTGRAELDEHVQGVESAEIDVRLEPGGRPRAAVLDEIRERLSLVPGTSITIGQPISHRIDHMLSGTRANIAVKVFGDDLAVLRALGGQAVAALQGTPGLVDLALEPQADIPTVHVGFDRTALARHGLPAGQAAATLETALRGRQVGQIVDRQTLVPLVLRYPPRRHVRPGRHVEPAAGHARGGARAAGQPGRHSGGPRPQPHRTRERRAADCRLRERRGAGSRQRRRGRQGARERRRRAAGRLPRGVRRAVRGRDRSRAPAPGTRTRRGRRHLPHPVQRVPVRPRRRHHHAQPAAGADRRRGRRVPGRRRALDRGADRLHRPLRHRHPQRHHARGARPAPALRGRGHGHAGRDHAGRGRSPGADPDDRHVNRPGAAAGRLRVRRAGQRDPGAAGAGHRLRPGLVHGAQHVRRARGLLGHRARRRVRAVRPRGSTPPGQHGVEAERPCIAGREVQEHETVHRRQLALVHDRPEPIGRCTMK